MAQQLDAALINGLVVRFLIDVVAMTALVFGLYYRRYRDKELVIAAAMFNIFIFLVLTVLAVVQFGIAAGFGLFAILALFTIRSEQISKIEISYLFGSVSIAVICSIQGTAYPFVALIVALLLFSAYVIDHPKMLRSVYRVGVTLDRIDGNALSDPAAMRQILSQRLSVEVMSFQVASMDYINELARLNVFYRKREGGPKPDASSTRTSSPWLATLRGKSEGTPELETSP